MGSHLIVNENEFTLIRHLPSFAAAPQFSGQAKPESCDVVACSLLVSTDKS